MNKISLKMKLGVGFGVLLLMIAVMGYVSYSSVNKLSDLSDEVLKQTEKTRLAYGADDGFEMQINGTRTFLLTGQDDALKHRQEGTEQAKENAAKLGPLLQTERGKAIFARLLDASGELERIQDSSIALRRAGNTKAAVDLMFDAHAKQLREEIDGIVDELEKLTAKLEDTAQAEHERVEARTISLILILAAAAFLMGVGMAVLIIRSVTGAVSRMVKMIQEIAANDLTVEDMEITSQ